MRFSSTVLSGKLRHTNDLYLDIHLNELLRQGVDLDKTRVDCAIESSELGDQTNIALNNRFVGIRTDETERNGAAEADQRSKGVDWAYPFSTAERKKARRRE